MQDEGKDLQVEPTVNTIAAPSQVRRRYVSEAMTSVALQPVCELLDGQGERVAPYCQAQYVWAGHQQKWDVRQLVGAMMAAHAPLARQKRYVRTSLRA